MQSWCPWAPASPLEPPENSMGHQERRPFSSEPSMTKKSPEQKMVKEQPSTPLHFSCSKGFQLGQPEQWAGLTGLHPVRWATSVTLALSRGSSVCDLSQGPHPPSLPGGSSGLGGLRRVPGYQDPGDFPSWMWAQDGASAPEKGPCLRPRPRRWASP